MAEEDKVQGKVYAVELCDGPLDGMSIAWHEDAGQCGFLHFENPEAKTGKALVSTYQIVTPNKARYLRTEDTPDEPDYDEE